ncbi:MAG: nucleotidyltransferase domain-containing protein [Magnetococcales bacterium]|nr:nucleotidyltransferase domain-containing protein [Magnetococcales bacterium]
MNLPGLAPLRFIETLKGLPFVEAIYLYGSRAHGTHGPRADIDLAIWCPGATPGEWRRVLEIVEDADTLLEIDCLRLDAEPETSRLRRHIEQDRVVIHVRNPGA